MNTAPAEIASRVVGSVLHQVLGVAARRVEEHEVGRRVVEEARQDAGQPRNTWQLIGWPSVSVTADTTAPKRAARAGAQDGDDRDDRQEDAGEQLGDLQDGPPAEGIAACGSRAW